MHRLVETEPTLLRHARAEARRGEQAQRPGDRSRLVGQDVAEHVLGHDHVVVRRLGQDQVGGRVDQRVLDADLGMGRRELIDDLAPEPAGGQHVCLVDTGEVSAPIGGELERQLHDALDLRARVPQRVDGRLDPVVLLASLRTAEVEAAGQLAQDQDVGAGPDLGTHRRRRIERGVGGDGAQVGEELERRSQAEQRVLGPGWCRGIIPLRTAHGAEQDGVDGTARLEGGSRQRVTGRVDRGTADQLLVPAHLESEARSGGLDAASRHVATSGPIPSPGR